MPCTRVVLPEPKGPINPNAIPGVSRWPMRRPKALVSLGECVSIKKWCQAPFLFTEELKDDLTGTWTIVKIKKYDLLPGP